jgi:hypothetical protein
MAFRTTPAQLTDQGHQLGVTLGVALASFTLASFTALSLAGTWSAAGFAFEAAAADVVVVDRF